MKEGEMRKIVKYIKANSFKGRYIIMPLNTMANELLDFAEKNKINIKGKVRKNGKIK